MTDTSDETSSENSAVSSTGKEEEENNENSAQEGSASGEGTKESGDETQQSKEESKDSEGDTMLAQVAAAAAAHSAKQGNQQDDEDDDTMDLPSFEMLFEVMQELEPRIAEYSESMLMLLIILANPEYTKSLAKLKSKSGSESNSDNAPVLDEDKINAQKEIAEDLIENTIQLHTHIEITYASMWKRLPKMSAESKRRYGPGADSIVLDLLPPCYSDKDPTTAFFRACSKKESSSTTAPPPPPPQRYEQHHHPEPPSNTSFASVITSKLGRIARSHSMGHGSNYTPPPAAEQRPQEEEEEYIEGHDYSIQISREMLGLTVENVLERTIVRTVLPNGAAKKAGAKVGSLIVQVGSVETKHLTHFETIDELRQSQRPLKLVLRRVSRKALAGAREEMGRLIRGGGYGHIWSSSANDEDHINLLLLLKYIQHIFREGAADTKATLNHNSNKKEDSLIKAGEKLIWISLLLSYGLERQTAPADFESLGSSQQFLHKDYDDAAKSVSKIILDYVIRVLNSRVSNADDSNSNNRKSQGRNARPSAMNKQRNPDQQQSSESPLFLIGDVLNRTQTFLADPYSPPAAVLRGELISLLCDVLDMDTEMELAEVDTGSSRGRGNKKSSAGGNITDLGSSGSLLKLIARNCPVMRSPTCHDAKAHLKHAGNRFLAVVHRLAASRSTSARVTACSLAPVLWSHLDFPHQLQLRGVITRALHDVEVIVRKSTAAVLHEIAELVFDSRAVPWLVLMCERAMTDPDPQLRAAAMTLTWHLAVHLPNAFTGDASKGSQTIVRLPSRSDPTFADIYLLQCKLLPVATRLGDDRAPSVRLAVAAQCDRLCVGLGEHWFSVIIDLLQALLSDSDDRVRSEAILCMPRLVENVLLGTNDASRGTVGVLEALLPVAVKLLKDSSILVRVSLATSFGELLTFLVGLGSENPIEKGDDLVRHKKHVDETLIPLVQRLLHDSDPEVTSAALRAVTNASRGNVKKKVNSRKANVQASGEDSDVSSHVSDDDSVEISEPVFVPVLSEKQVLRLLPTLSDLATSHQWRVRQSAVEIVPALLGCTHLLETRTKIAQLCVTLMGDHVDAVRRTAAECLCLGGSGLASGSSSNIPTSGKKEWVSELILPHVNETTQSKSYKQRILGLKMIEITLANNVCASLDNRRKLIDIAFGLSEDIVANVRLNVGRVFAYSIQTFDEESLIYSLEKLETFLSQEKDRAPSCDRDVIFFLNKAMAKAKQKNF